MPLYALWRSQSIHEFERSSEMNSNGYTITEIFSDIPVNRTCADFYMLPLTRWKCEGFDAEIPVNDSANGHMGLAEFAVGYINDAIQKQYMSGETASVCWYILLLCLNHFAMKEIWKSTITNFHLKSILKGEQSLSKDRLQDSIASIISVCLSSFFPADITFIRCHSWKR